MKQWQSILEQYHQMGGGGGEGGGIFVNLIRTTQYNNIFKSWWKSYISNTRQNIPYAIRVDAKIDKFDTKKIFPQIIVTYKTCRN